MRVSAVANRVPASHGANSQNKPDLSSSSGGSVRGGVSGVGPGLRNRKDPGRLKDGSRPTRPDARRRQVASPPPLAASIKLSPRGSASEQLSASQQACQAPQQELVEQEPQKHQLQQQPPPQASQESQQQERAQQQQQQPQLQDSSQQQTPVNQEQQQCHQQQAPASQQQDLQQAQQQSQQTRPSVASRFEVAGSLVSQQLQEFANFARTNSIVGEVIQKNMSTQTEPWTPMLGNMRRSRAATVESMHSACESASVSEPNRQRGMSEEMITARSLDPRNWASASPIIGHMERYAANMAQGETIGEADASIAQSFAMMLYGNNNSTSLRSAQTRPPRPDDETHWEASSVASTAVRTLEMEDFLRSAMAERDGFFRVCEDVSLRIAQLISILAKRVGTARFEIVKDRVERGDVFEVVSTKKDEPETEAESKDEAGVKAVEVTPEFITPEVMEVLQTGLAEIQALLDLSLRVRSDFRIGPLSSGQLLRSVLQGSPASQHRSPVLPTRGEQQSVREGCHSPSACHIEGMPPAMKAPAACNGEFLSSSGGVAPSPTKVPGPCNADFLGSTAGMGQAAKAIACCSGDFLGSSAGAPGPCNADFLSSTAGMGQTAKSIACSGDFLGSSAGASFQAPLNLASVPPSPIVEAQHRCGAFSVPDPASARAGSAATQRHMTGVCPTCRRQWDDALGASEPPASVGSRRWFPAVSPQRGAQSPQTPQYPFAPGYASPLPRYPPAFAASAPVTPRGGASPAAPWPGAPWIGASHLNESLDSGGCLFNKEEARRRTAPMRHRGSTTVPPSFMGRVVRVRRRKLRSCWIVDNEETVEYRLQD